MSTPWTADEDMILKDAYVNKKTFAQIAAELPGRTRNMVAGRTQRLGLSEPRAKALARRASRAPLDNP